MGGIYEVDIVHALINQFEIDLPQALHAHFFAETVVRKIKILAETAFQAASAEKHRAGTLCAGNHGFFIVMGRRTGDDRLRAHAAYALAGFSAQCIAVSGAEIADESFQYFHYNI